MMTLYVPRDGQFAKDLVYVPHWRSRRALQPNRPPVSLPHVVSAAAEEGEKRLSRKHYRSEKKRRIHGEEGARKYSS